MIADRVRQAIIRGELHAGQPLRQADIAQKFGVSRIPVREALSLLEGQGWVTSTPHKGVVVSELSADDSRELTELRVLLECRALRLAIPNMTSATFAQAKKILDETEDDEGSETWTERNWAFHSTLYAPANRPRLLSLLENLHALENRYLYMHVSIMNYRDQGQREHRALLAACRKRDAAAAEKILKKHITDVADMLDTFLRQRQATRDW